MKDKMILKDGTVMEMEACASLGAVQILFADCAEMAATWEKLTDQESAGSPNPERRGTDRGEIPGSDPGIRDICET